MARSDESYLRRALALARRGRYRTSPNPRVGAVVVRRGEVVGEGYHRRLGGPHAEAEALVKAGRKARGATLYVTLEPCNHQGRTPACTEAVLAAGVRRVVACHRDPNPGVAGGGFTRLLAAGVEVDEGRLLEEAVEMNWRFLVAATLGRPAVTLKWAMSLDGKISTARGDSQWISSPEGRRWGLQARDEHDAILVGIGTALADDPRLDRRTGRAGGPNVRVVLDRELRLPATARLLEIPGEVLIYTESKDAERRAALVACGATVVGLRRVTPAAVLRHLGRRGVQSVLVEGGAGVAASFAEAGLYDAVTVDLAPLLIGGATAPGPLGGAGFPRLPSAPRLDGLRVERRGPDVILRGFRERCLPDLYASVAASSTSHGAPSKGA